MIFLSVMWFLPNPFCNLERELILQNTLSLFCNDTSIKPCTLLDILECFMNVRVISSCSFVEMSWGHSSSRTETWPLDSGDPWQHCLNQRTFWKWCRGHLASVLHLCQRTTGRGMTKSTRGNDEGRKGFPHECISTWMLRGSLFPRHPHLHLPLIAQGRTEKLKEQSATSIKM